MIGQQEYERFIGVLEQALRYLYDPAELNRLRLAEWLGLGPARSSPLAVQDVLVRAIRALKPSTAVPEQANAWRYYDLLVQWYLEQLSQEQVARTLSLSSRQLRRLRPQAIDTLARHLCSQYDVHCPSLGTAPTETAGPGGPQHEITWLESASTRQEVLTGSVIASVLSVIRPLAQSKAVDVHYTERGDVPPIVAEVISLRHALLTLLSEVIRHHPSGTIEMVGERLGERVVITISASFGVAPPCQAWEALGVTRELLVPSDGVLEIACPPTPAAATAFRITLPVLDRIPILVMDDNADALCLFERYLSGTRYRFVGVCDPVALTESAIRVQPRAIVLDLMLPRIDGWELLGRVRSNPVLRNIPVVVCTVLPQEDLALALGAATFIRKPITRQEFLAALDEQVGPSGSRC